MRRTSKFCLSNPSSALLVKALADPSCRRSRGSGTQSSQPPNPAPWIAVEWLPRYAPELNRIERSWRDLKRHHLAHRTFKTASDLGTGIWDAVKQLNTERQTPHPCDKLNKAA